MSERMCCVVVSPKTENTSAMALAVMTKAMMSWSVKSTVSIMRTLQRFVSSESKHCPLVQSVETSTQSASFHTWIIRELLMRSAELKNCGVEHRDQPPPKADMCSAARDVGYGQKRTSTLMLHFNDGFVLIHDHYAEQSQGRGTDHLASVLMFAFNILSVASFHNVVRFPFDLCGPFA